MMTTFSTGYFHILYAQCYHLLNQITIFVNRVRIKLDFPFTHAHTHTHTHTHPRNTTVLLTMTLSSITDIALITEAVIETIPEVTLSISVAFEIFTDKFHQRTRAITFLYTAR